MEICLENLVVDMRIKLKCVLNKMEKCGLDSFFSDQDQLAGSFGHNNEPLGSTGTIWAS
jgi:hypothetical protein